MPRLQLQLPAELGPTGGNRTERASRSGYENATGTDAEPRIIRWLACWAGRRGA